MTGTKYRGGSKMRAIAEGLFTSDSPQSLLGGREKGTGRIVFPCPESETYEPVALSREGTLWSYTVQRFRPKSPPYRGPEAFAPWILAYVELPGEVIVEARLVDVEPEDVKIGMPLSFAPTPLDPDGSDSAMIPAFAPLKSAGDAA